MRVLLTARNLDQRAGVELYLRDVACGLLARGHEPVVYSPNLGGVAREIAEATVPVVDDLSKPAAVPDVIHGHSGLETWTALLRFPSTPALHVCHSFRDPYEEPPRTSRLATFAAVDEACRDRLVQHHGVPAEQVHIVPNFVDLERFAPGPALPARPRRALFFSNYGAAPEVLAAVREGCARHGVALDTAGAEFGAALARPEHALPGYDLVFAKGRAALESLACGRAVILTGLTRLGPLVRRADLDALRRRNLGVRALGGPITADAVARAIAAYDPPDAARCAERVRETAGLDGVLDALLALYRAAIERFGADPKRDAEAEARDVSRLLEALSRLRVDDERARARRQQERAARRAGRRPWRRWLSPRGPSV